MRTSNFFFLISILLFFFHPEKTSGQAIEGSKTGAITSLNLSARNLKTSVLWYKRNLGFVIKDVKINESGKLKMEGLEISVKQPKRTLLAKNIKLPKGKMQINGFNELGFKTSFFDSLYQYLDEKNIKVDSIVASGPPADTRKFVAYDPDGNRIHFIEDQSLEKPNFPGLEVYFYSLITADLKNALSWYRDRLGFEETYNLDSPTKNRFCRIMQRGNIVLEIIHSPNRSMETTELLSYDVELAGFSRIGLTLNEKGSPKEDFDNDGNRLLIKK